MDLPDLSNVKEFAFDYETMDEFLTEKGPGAIFGTGKVVGLAVYLDSGFNEYFPIAHAEGNIDYNQLHPWLVALFSDPKRVSIAANYRYDAEYLWLSKIENKTKATDIQVLEAILDEEKRSYSLASISKDYGLPPKSSAVIEQALIVAGHTKQGKPDWSKIYKLPVDLVGTYAKYDAKATFNIYQLQKPKIIAEDLTRVADLEAKLSPVLLSMRTQGIRVDLDKADFENNRLRDLSEVMLKEIHKDAPFLNVFSPKQLATHIRSLGVEPGETEKGNDSVSNDLLLHSGVPNLVLIGQYRQQEKVRRDFIESMILEGSYKGRLHPQFFSTRGSSFQSGDDVGGTRSGRLSTVTPNLAQIPSRHPTLGKLVRSMFLPEEGERWCKLDYASQEPRITAHFAYLMELPGTSKLRDAYIANPKLSFHEHNMGLINQIVKEPINKGVAKTIGLGLTYGLGKVKMAKALGLTQGASAGLLMSFHEAVPWLKPLMNIAMDRADTQGYVKTILGRRRRFNMYEPQYFERGKFPIAGLEEAKKAYGNVRKSGLHKALNSVVQGTAAEQMKLALVALYSEGINIKNTIYDEVALSVTEKSEALKAQQILIDALPLEIPVYAEGWLGDNWAGDNREEL